MIDFRVCPNDTQKGLDKWLNIAKKIKEIFGQEVELKPFKNFIEEEALCSIDDFKPDIYYASFDISLLLLEKHYKLIGRFKNKNDVFLVIGLKGKDINYQNVKTVSIPDKAIAFYILDKLNLYDKEVILLDSFDDMMEFLLNEKADIGIFYKDYYDELGLDIKDNLKIIEKLDLDVGRYFFVSEEFYEKNKDNINKLIELLDLEEVSNEDLNKIKEYSKSGKILRDLVIHKILEKSLQDINHLIVSAKTEEELFNQICQSLVDKNHLKFVWIGKKDKEFIKPVCKRGKDDGYVDNLVTSTRADVPEGRGPVGTAYRENEIVINENTLVSEFMKPWKDELLKRDIYSSLSIPVEKSGEVYAVITVYSTKPFMFKKEFLIIFEELKRDISFVLNKIEEEKLLKEFALLVSQDEGYRLLTKEEYKEFIEKKKKAKRLS